MRYAKIIYPDTGNGKGVRVSLFLQGCSRHCKGCFNEGTWDFNGGMVFDSDTKAQLIKLLEPYYVRGLSVLGGEPLEQEQELAELLREIKQIYPHKDIWLWTGNDYENVKNSPVFKYVDYCVDGAFIENLQDLNLEFRGSSNQRIIEIRR